MPEADATTDAATDATTDATMDARAGCTGLVSDPPGRSPRRYLAGGNRSRVSTSSAAAIFLSRPIVGDVCKVSSRDSCARLTPAVSASRFPLQPCCLASDRICLAMCR